MEYRMLGHSSLSYSVLGMGGLHFGVFCTKSNTVRLIHKALDFGINFIDTAPLYGNGHSEAFIRNAICDRRDKVLLSTKAGLESRITPDGTFGVSVAPLTKDFIRSSLEKSLRALGTDYIDLYQVHAFDPNTPLEETMQTLDTLVQEGKVRFVGCSNYNHTELEIACRISRRYQWEQFTSSQVHYNLIERRAEQSIVPTCEAFGVGIICYRALARGILASKYKPNKPFPEGSRALTSFRVRRWLSERMLLLVEALDKFAQNYGYSSTELSIAWLLSRAMVSVVLVGVRDLDQLETCVRAIEWSLSREDLLEVDMIISGLNLVGQVKMMPETFFET